MTSLSVSQLRTGSISPNPAATAVSARALSGLLPLIRRLSLSASSNRSLARDLSETAASLAASRISCTSRWPSDRSTPTRTACAPRGARLRPTPAGAAARRFPAGGRARSSRSLRGTTRRREGSRTPGKRADHPAQPRGRCRCRRRTCSQLLPHRRAPAVAAVRYGGWSGR